MGPRNRPHGTPSNFSEWCSLCAMATRFRYGTCIDESQMLWCFLSAGMAAAYAAATQPPSKNVHGAQTSLSDTTSRGKAGLTGQRQHTSLLWQIKALAKGYKRHLVVTGH